MRVRVCVQTCEVVDMMIDDQPAEMARPGENLCLRIKGQSTVPSHANACRQVHTQTHPRTNAHAPHMSPATVVAAGIEEENVQPGYVLGSVDVPPAIVRVSGRTCNSVAVLQALGIDCQLVVMDLMDHKPILTAGYTCVCHIHRRVLARARPAPPALA